MSHKGKIREVITVGARIPPFLGVGGDGTRWVEGRGRNGCRWWWWWGKRARMDGGVEVFWGLRVKWWNLVVGFAVPWGKEVGGGGFGWEGCVLEGFGRERMF